MLRLLLAVDPLVKRTRFPFLNSVNQLPIVTSGQEAVEMLLFQKPVINHAVKELQKRIEIAGDIEKSAGLFMKSQLRPGVDLENFFERPDPSRQGDERIGKFSHHGLPLVHGGDGMQLCETDVSEFLFLERFRNDSDDFAACVKSSIGDGPHETDVSAPVDHPDSFPGQKPAQGEGRLAVFRTTAGTGAAVDADRLESLHGDSQQGSTGNSTLLNLIIFFFPGNGIAVKSLNIMKFLTFAIILPLFAMIPNGFSQDGDFDLDSIKTVDGKRYLEIWILDADDHGMTFRHRDGIAKLPFHQLSMNLRMLYEPVAEVADAEGEVEEELFVFSEDASIQATASTRLTAPIYWLRGAYTQMPQPQMAPWPSHWPRYHPAHALAYPAYRELAVRDFLYTTGLAERPPGIHPYALPRHGPYCFH